ncbi:MAG: putative nucleic acid-binding protein [Candidatus Latescibacterota bacterium]|jgi:predicted nucleic acid-binding protein
MPTYLLDASGLCKRYFTNEIGSDLINDLFNDEASTRYLLNFTILEVLNALYRVHREGYLSESERDALIAAFYRDISNGSLLVYSVHDLHIFNAESTIQRIQAMPVIKKRSGPMDALVITCASDFNLSELILISSDVDLNAIAQQVNILTFDPEKPFSRLQQS